MFLNDNYKLIDLSKNELIDAFINVLKFNGFELISIENNYKFENLITIKDGITNSFYCNFANIRNVYLPKYPYLLRRQVTALDHEKLIKSTDYSFSFLVGVVEVDSKICFSIWNPWGFINHKKNRSCYVVKDDLNKMSSLHFLKSKFSHTIYYLFDKEGFLPFLDQYKEDVII